jgi:heme o synthase
VPMLPVVAGARATRVQILVYALLLLPVAVGIGFTSIGGPVYLVGATILSVMFARGAWSIWRRDEAAALADSHGVEKRFFGFSILYMFLIFGLILVEAVLAAAGLALPAWPPGY